MLHTSWGYILVRSFPECAILLMLGCNFLNLKISSKTILKKNFNFRFNDFICKNASN